MGGTVAGWKHQNTAATDLVRLEVEAALRKDIPVVPVLVAGAAMPQPNELPDGLQDFAFRNAVKVDALEDFDDHVKRLIRSLDRLLRNQLFAQQEETRLAELAAALESGASEMAGKENANLGSVYSPSMHDDRQSQGTIVTGPGLFSKAGWLFWDVPGVLVIILIVVWLFRLYAAVSADVGKITRILTQPAAMDIAHLQRVAFDPAGIAAGAVTSAVHPKAEV